LENNYSSIEKNPSLNKFFRGSFSEQPIGWNQWFCSLFNRGTILKDSRALKLQFYASESFFFHELKLKSPLLYFFIENPLQSLTILRSFELVLNFNSGAILFVWKGKFFSILSLASWIEKKILLWNEEYWDSLFLWVYEERNYKKSPKYIWHQLEEAWLTFSKSWSLSEFCASTLKILFLRKIFSSFFTVKINE